MAFVITEPCLDIKDKSCVDACPVQCIHGGDEADRILYIHPIDCIDCGACLEACPVTAIFEEERVPASSAKFIEINRLYFRDKEAARAEVNALYPERRESA
ncbi:MAG: ferredoxin family protein [Chloroflexi bacterium]|nr:ferredoxin family protein [Chloroflexota bacterium]OJV94061.1 MAG: hypothetical protein BGO39_07045 [Chloroflexi bacterium 54-19]